MTCNGKCGCGVGSIVKVLLIIGGLNWGLTGVGMFMSKNLNVVNMLLNSMPILEAIIYIVVGLAAIMSIFGCPCAKCKACKAGDTATTSM
ncbi:DUF378 domain-containing protein [Candidatus Nomurabacteria bacterium]|nr:DUF378 domain-containing protein [Candidatus Nomurabacteria bacterium]